MFVVLDLIVVSIVVLTMITVLKKGFIKTLIGFASVIFGIIFAKILSPFVSTLLYDGLYNSTIDSIEGVVKDWVSNNALPSMFELDNVSGMLGKYNSGLASDINGAVSSNLAHSISENIVGLLSYAIAFLIVFIVTVILFKILGVILTSIFKLPVLKTLDRVLSVGLGIVMSVVYLMVFAAFMQVLIPVISTLFPNIINSATVDSTILFEFIYNFEWIRFFVN